MFIQLECFKEGGRVRWQLEEKNRKEEDEPVDSADQSVALVVGDKENEDIAEDEGSNNVLSITLKTTSDKS